MKVATAEENYLARAILIRFSFTPILKRENVFLSQSGFVQRLTTRYLLKLL